MSEEVKYDGVIHKWSVYVGRGDTFRIMGITNNEMISTAVVERIEGDVAYTKQNKKYKLKDPLFSYGQLARQLKGIKREHYKTYE